MSVDQGLARSLDAGSYPELPVSVQRKVKYCAIDNEHGWHHTKPC